MKVLIITNSYPDQAASYRGIFIRKLCLELIRQGLEVVVLTPRVLRQSPRFENDGSIRIHRFWYPSGNKPLGQAGGIPILPMAFYMASGFITAMRLIAREKPDVIHGNWIVPTGLIAALAGYLTRIPVINTARGMDVRISAKGFVSWLFDLAVKLSDRLVVVSPAMRSRQGLEKAAVISSGVDEVFFALASEQRIPVILSNRSLEPVYDVDTLLNSLPTVAKEIPAVRCVIAGTGSQEPYLKDRIRPLQIDRQVLFLGTVPQAEIVRQMQQASVFVSCCRDDGTSVALLEAMAAGLIPVVTDIPANRSWVKHGEDGFLFPSGDSRTLADHILQAMHGRIAVSALENKRERLKETVAWPRIAAQYVQIYASIGAFRR